ncbi:hypothetical protein FSP39_011803 [Pinctada imbricata]|uniref:G-protein coupled receptors family 1 profile domain-containing protein n=1 Tax=Pinctada imbricata TaxID=66713 RepID=A0AA89C590_PINIB|nr:hypothetical protein FSP39_011803 [Pinctada imbricata]
MSVINLSLPNNEHEFYYGMKEGRMQYREHNDTSGHSLFYMDHSHDNPCYSNSTIWALTSDICSINFSSFVAFVIVAILLAVITLWTIFGNILVWVALYKFPNLRSMSNCLIGNLAVSDLVLAMTVLPISAGHDLLGYWIFGKTLCIIWLCMDVLYCTASIWGLCTIAVDRFSATVFPVWYYERKSPLRALVYIIFVWLFSIIVSLAPFIGWRDMIPTLYRFNTKINRYECVLFQTEGYVVYSAMGSFVIPIILMTFLYVRIFFVLRQRSKTLNPKRRKLRYSFETDFDSCAIHEVSSQLDLANPVTMTDKATQVSPVSKKENDKHSKQTCGERNESERNHQPNPSETYGTHNSNSTPTDLADIICRNRQDLRNSDERIPCLPEKSISKSSTSIQNGHSHYLSVTGTTDAPDEKTSISPTRSLRSIDGGCIRKGSQKMNENGRNSSLRVKGRSNRHKQSGIKTRYEIREQRATKRMAIVMACFLVCWMPFLFMYIIRSFCVSCDLNAHIQASIIWLGYANSGINPILYTLFNDDFRKAFKLILGFKSKQKRPA